MSVDGELKGRHREPWQLMSVLLLTAFGLLTAVHAADNETTSDVLGRGMIVTSPRVWLSGSKEKTCIITHGLTFDVLINITLQGNAGNGPVHSRKTVTLPSGGNKCIQVSVPSGISDSNAKLLVSAEPVDAANVYNFSKTATVTIKVPTQMTFIQTDKPIYKPGDTVRIRVLTLDGPDLLLQTDDISLAYIEDPSRTRVMQWTNISTTKGLASLEMQLSDEPRLGEWTIKALINRQTESQKFSVEEYVLPKYEVSVVHPSYISYLSSNVTWKACASYTYGQPVNGNVSSNVCIRREYMMPNAKPPCIPMSPTKLKDGCAEFTVNSSDLQMQDYRWGGKLVFFAEVKEHGTNVKLNTTTTVKIHTSIYQLTFLSDEFGSSHYKPGLPFYGWGKVTYPDESPAAGTVVKIHTTLLRSENRKDLKLFPDLELTTAADGTFRYVLPGNSTGQKLDAVSQEAIVSNVQEPHSPRNTKTLIAWYSPSNSFLQIEPFDQTVACGSTLSLPVVFLTSRDSSLTFHFQLTSRGDIVHVGQLSALPSVVKENSTDDGNSVYNFNVTFAVTHRMSGHLRLLVFTILPSGETVADSLMLSVEKCFKNHVSMRFTDRQKQPGHSTVLRVTADPDSLCSILVVDKSVKLMSAKDSSVSKSKVFGMLNEYDVSRKSHGPYHGIRQKEDCGHVEETPSDWDPDYGYPWYHHRRRRRMIMYPNHLISDYVDSKEAFVNVGMIVLSDLKIVTKPCRRNWYHFIQYSSHSMEMRGSSGQAIHRRRLNSPMGRIEPEAFEAMASLPDDDDRNALEANEFTNKATPVLHRTFFPESWLWQLKFVGDDGVENVNLDVPHTITEWVGGGFCSNTETGLGVSSPFSINAFQPFFLSFTIPYSVIRGERVNIPVSVFNYLNQCLKVTLYVQKSSSFELHSNSPVTELTVCAHETKTHTYNIEPRELGNINFTIKATSVASNKVETNLVEDQEIAAATDIVTQKLLVEAEGKEEELTKSEFVCAPGSGTWSMDLPDVVIVPDSLRAHSSIIGDVMGPTLTGLESLLALPTGCGEQNMLKFSPNIFVMHYLQKTNSLTEAIKKTATEFLLTGYQRELTYRHADGSYSAFGSSDPEGSIWLTAFVVKSFAQAKPFISIDQADLDKSVKWLTSAQLENGCFPQIGVVLHKAMKGGLADKSDSLAPLTAYIVVSLLEAGMDSKDPVILQAIQCLNIHKVEDAYTQSLMLYAYTMWNRNDTKRAELYRTLQAKAVVSDGMKHWTLSSDDQSSAPSAIEMTSYMLLSVLHGNSLDAVAEATTIVRWLTTQRNSRGGFSSTQDTVIALQALAQFAALVHRDGLEATVTITGTGWSHIASVTNGNRLLLQRQEGQSLPAKLHYNVSGTGCVLIQASKKYNTVPKDQSDAELPFALNVEVHRIKSNSCKERTLKICTSYNGADNASNMAVIAVKMVSGWIPDKDSIKKLMNHANLRLKRYEVDKNVVQLYFGELDKKERCLTFHVHQNVVVHKTKPVLVHVYDYYLPSLSTYTKYSIVSTCGTKEEIRDTGNEPVSQKNRTVISQTRIKPALDLSKFPGPSKSQSNCPECDLRKSAPVKNKYCSTPFVYEAFVVNKTVLTVQKQVNSNSSIDKDVVYRLPKNCKCAALGKRNGVSVVLVMKKEFKPKNKKTTLNLNAETAVIESSRIASLVRKADDIVCP